MGTILPYKGAIKDIPEKWALCNGSNGTPDLTTGRFLEGSSSAGSFKNAGLPNIKGDIRNGAGYRSYSIGHGAFTVPTTGQNKQNDTNQSGSNFMKPNFDFDASKGTVKLDGSYMTQSESPYGKSETVQPKSYTVLYIMKIKA